MNAGKNMLISAALLGGFAIVGTALVAFTDQNTASQVAANQSAYTLGQLHQIISARALDNDLEHDTIQVTDPLLGSRKPMTVYRARKDGKPVAAIIEAVAPDGYSGKIVMLVGVRYNGSLLGVRVTEHHETPGLGDNIDTRKSNWILQFNNLSLSNPKPANWKVKRDGGAIDQITSATISSRAVTKAVYHALEYFKAHREALFRVSKTSSRGQP